jgi:hypothetical protein
MLGVISHYKIDVKTTLTRFSVHECLVGSATCLASDGISLRRFAITFHISCA